MCALIVRRGPDDGGFFFDGHVGLAMRRLAVIDVNSGRQPVYNEDRTVAVVFNGEIYNYKELRETLLKRGHLLTTFSDTECIAHLYEDFGEDYVTQLRGMFAVAIWDVRQKKLLLARDRLGIKPLYYWQDGQDLYFGSELKCLLSVDRYERQMDLQSVSEFFTFKYVPGPRTIYRGIAELPPGIPVCGAMGSSQHGDTGNSSFLRITISRSTIIVKAFCIIWRKRCGCIW